MQNYEYSPKTKATINQQKLLSTSPFRRTSTYHQRNSPRKSDSNYSSFFVKQVNKIINDPQSIQKLINKKTHQKSPQQKVLQKKLQPNLPRKKSKQSICSQKCLSQTRKFLQLCQKQAQTIQQLTIQKIELREKYLKLQNQFQFLQKQKETIQQNLKKLVLQSTNDFLIQNQNNYCKSHGSQIKNKINKNKFYKNNIKNNFEPNLQLQNTKLAKTEISLEKQLFQARQTIKFLNLQIDCLKIKFHHELQNQKTLKNLQYSQLKKRFLQILHKYTQVNKNFKKQEITQKIKNCKKKIHLQQSLTLSLTLSMSSDEQNHLKS